MRTYVLDVGAPRPGAEGIFVGHSLRRYLAGSTSALGILKSPAQPSPPERSDGLGREEGAKAIRGTSGQHPSAGDEALEKFGRHVLRRGPCALLLSMSQAFLRGPTAVRLRRLTFRLQDRRRAASARPILPAPYHRPATTRRGSG